MHPKTRRLRLIAFVGILVVLIHEVWPPFSLESRQEMAIVLLVAALVAVPLTLVVFLRPALRRILGAADVLVPLGILTFALTFLGWLATVPLLRPVMSPSYDVDLFNIAVSISVFLLFVAVLHVAYAAWTTTLILNLVRRGNSDPVDALQGVRRWFWRVLGLEAICIAVLFLGIGVAIATGGAAWLVLVALLLGLNFSTAALLPVALDESLRFSEALSRGIRISLSGMKQWALPVLAQLVLLGAVTYVSVSYSDGSGRHHSSTNVGVHGFWIGGYENECRWYGAFMDAYGVAKVGVVVTALNLIFGVLAIAVKLTVVERLEALSAPRADSLSSLR